MSPLTIRPLFKGGILHQQGQECRGWRHNEQLIRTSRAELAV